MSIDHCSRKKMTPLFVERLLNSSFKRLIMICKPLFLFNRTQRNLSGVDRDSAEAGLKPGHPILRNDRSEKLVQRYEPQYKHITVCGANVAEMKLRSL